MADVFTPSLLTSTKPNAAAIDCAKPPSGSLNFSGMTSATALGGTTGTSVALIHGDVWDQFEGNDTTNVLKDQKLTVIGNLTEMVVQNYKETIVGTTTSTYIGVHNQVNISPRNDTFFHTRSEDHHHPEQIHQPTSQVNIQRIVTEYLSKHTKYSSWYFTVLAVKMEIVPIVSLGYFTLKGELGVIATKALALEKQSKAIDAKFQAATTNFTMTAILASVLWAKVIAFDGNAGIAANIDSPFA
jgi:hypothetical protein